MRVVDAISERQLRPAELTSAFRPSVPAVQVLGNLGEGGEGGEVRFHPRERGLSIINQGLSRDDIAADL